MGNPNTKARVSQKRKRNFIAKELVLNRQYRKKIHVSEKDREKQRQWRLREDPESDYNSLDDFLMGSTNGTEG